MSSPADPPPRLDALLRDALADEDARLAALEARVQALRRAPAPRTAPTAGPKSAPKDDTTKVDLKSHPGHPGDREAAILARAVRAHMTGEGPGYEDTTPIPREAPPPRDDPADLDDERLEAARRVLLESSQSLAELRSCLAGVAPEAPAVAPPWALELVAGVATVQGSLERLELLLVEVGRAVAAVLERSRAGEADPPPAPRESPTARLRRALAERARPTGERTPSSTARAALAALDASVDAGQRRDVRAERRAILEAFERLSDQRGAG